MELPSDDDLIRNAAAGDLRAFEYLVGRYEDLVARYVFRIVPTAEDREEVCQDVFMKVFSNLDQFRFDSKFSTWLYSIAYRTAVSATRRKVYETVEYDEARDHASWDSPAEQRETQRILEEAMASLNLDDRSMLALFHLNDCTIEEISKIVGKPEGTVKNQLFRIRKRLKERISDTIDE